MQLDPNDLDSRAIYKIMTGAIVPRPIGWISTVSADGINNVAPFSYFTPVSSDPPHVLFSSGRRNGTNKDTLNNVIATETFCVNVVSAPLLEAMNLSATTLPPDVDEFEFAGVTAAASTKVAAPHVAEALIVFECELSQLVPVGSNMVVIGRIVMMHIADSVYVADHKIDTAALQPVGRLAGANYAPVTDIISLDRS